MNLEKLQKSPKDKVLIVDDSEPILFLLKEICEGMGLEVETAINGQLALDKLKDHTFSLFIVDLMMPVMNGWEFIPILKKKIPDALILVQTAVNNPDDIVKIMKLGV